MLQDYLVDQLGINVIRSVTTVVVAANEIVIITLERSLSH